MVILIGADGGKLGGPVRFLNDAAEAAQVYARGKLAKKESDRQDQEVSDHLKNTAQERTLRENQDRRAQQAADQNAALAPIEQGIASETLRSHKSANNAQDEWEAQQRAAQVQEKQFALDAWKQQQAKEYKKVTGEDVPESFWGDGTDAEGHAPGTPGWHWSMYNPRSPVPIEIQQQVQKGLFEASTLPPGASRAQKVAELKTQAADAVRAQHAAALLEDIQSHAAPTTQDQGAEQNPQQFAPPETIDKLQRMIADPKTNLDQVEIAWQKTKDANAQKIAATEAKIEALNRIDQHFATMAERDAAYGHLGKTIDPMDWEHARALRHQIEGSKLSGPALAAAEQQVYAVLKGERPIKGENDKTGLSPGKALELAMGEAADPMSALSKKLKAAPEDQHEQIIEMRARGLLNSARNLAGQGTPGSTGPGPHGGFPNTPEAQSAAEAANKKARGGKPSPQDADTLQQKAKAAGWTRDEFIKFGQTGEQPSGKSPIQ